MKMKATKFSLFGLLALLFVFTACEDDFSEQDLLELQAELAETKAQNDFDRRLQELAAMAEDAQELATLNDALARATAEYLEILEDALEDENDSLAAAEALALFRAAGFIVQYDVEVVSNDAGISDIAVSMTTAAGAVIADTTEADGIARFADVPTGIATVSVTGSDYLPISYDIDFGAPNSNLINITVNGQSTTFVNPVNGKTLVQMVASGTITGAATISGTVEGDVDLTSDDEELIQGLVVSASLAEIDNSTGDAADNNLISTTGSFTGAATSTSGVKFDIDGFSMTDTTDASGEYSIMVPASEDVSFEYDVVFPSLITTTQYMAAVSSTTDSVEVVGVDAVWGADLGTTNNSGSIPSVDGYQVVTADPASLGTGFAIAVEDTVERALSAGNLPALTTANEGTRTSYGTGGNSGWQTGIVTIDELGTNPFATPTLTVNGTAVSTASFFYERDYAFSNNTTAQISVTTDGTNGFYTELSAQVGTVYLQLIGTAQGTTDSDTLLFEIGAVNSDGTGNITSASFAASTASTWTNLNVYRSEDTPNASDLVVNDGETDERNYEEVFTGSYDLNGTFNLEDDFNMVITSTDFSVFFGETGTESAVATRTNATFTYTNGNGITVNNPTIDEADDAASTGSYRTAPTTITGSNGFQLTFNAFAFQYEVSINNSGASGYSVVPGTIEFSGNAWTSTTTSGTRSSADVQARNSSGNAVGGGNDDFSNLLTVTNDTLTPYNPTVTQFLVDEFFTAPPSLVTIEDDATEVDLTPNFNGTGGISSFTANNTGNQYDATFSVSVIGRPIASNAAGNGLDLSPSTSVGVSIANTAFSTDARTKEVTWTGGHTIDEAGEGYVSSINFGTFAQFSINGTATTSNSSRVTATVDGEITVDVDYGLGDWVDDDLTLQGDN